MKIKVLVMSDNHGDILTMDKIIAKENADYTIHCGDYLIPKSEMERRFNYFVPGNNDNDVSNLEINIKIGNFSFLVLHGHTFGYSIYKPEKILKQALKWNYDAIIFGHLHIPIFLEEKNKYIFCPGSVSYPRNIEGPTYGLIFIDGDQIKFVHKKVTL